MVTSKFLSTANGRIKCLRCSAQSTRTKLQCGRPALKKSKTQKCQFHGGSSTGPTSADGRLQIAKVKTTHGFETSQVRKERSLKIFKLLMLQEVLIFLRSFASRGHGRRPKGVHPVRSLEEARQVIFG